MDDKYKKILVGSLAGGLIFTVSLYVTHGAKILEIAKSAYKYNQENVYSMEISTWKEACKHYESCKEQPHTDDINPLIVSGNGTMETFVSNGILH